jgi:1-acyl-sn-glycerol-3-phosphate acyltransferase
LTAFRSALFNIAFFGWTIILAVLYLPLLALPRSVMWMGARFWARSILFFLRHIIGMSYEVRGLERLPKQGCLIAAKHQSAWETMAFNLILAEPAFVLKKELLSIPLFGFYLMKTGMVAIDRKAGAKALKLMLASGREELAKGRPVVIFPEGTRTAPGETAPYHPGIAALYAGADAPCVPVALNSGLYWRRNSFIKRPGKVIVEFLEPMPPGQDRKAFQKDLQARIEEATARLVAEGL